MITKYIIINGRVQGIGYRPFIAETAEKFNIKGWVRNVSGVVSLMITCEENILMKFLDKIKNDCSGALIEKIDISDEELMLFDDFRIIESQDEDMGASHITSDIATCEGCLNEMRNINNRRYVHPFISCVSCGPRYSIIEKLPYDRENITMEYFKLCDECEKEYVTNGKRHHAQTIACNKCGPKLIWHNKNMCQEGSIALKYAIDYLQKGGIVAVKDIGGYHLVCLSDNKMAVNELRKLKYRYTKPFAIMFPDVKSIEIYCELNDMEIRELESQERPIVLLNKKNNTYYEVCKNSPYIGAMLPCNPLQTMLVEVLGPLVMTSANRSGELIITDDEQMIQWSKDIGILMNDRKIVTPLDDSIIRIVAGRKQIIRRCRGYVPEPINFNASKEIFALGGDLKSVFCYTKNNKAYMSQQLGDLEDEEVLIAFKKEKEHMKKLFGFKPQLVAGDLHPKYVFADMADIRIQHHKAHVATVIAEHQIKENVIGVAFDGTGYGEDGNVWGSEFFIVKNNDMKRIAHLKNISLQGGNEGTRNSRNILYGYINSFDEDTKNTIFDAIAMDMNRYKLITKAINCGINRINSSSMGRLFDAVSALLGICNYNSYEGEAAIELEYAAATTRNFYPLSITVIEKESVIGDTEKMFESIATAIKKEVSINELARGFIYAVGDWVIEVCQIINQKNNSAMPVVLSGGTFFNRILVEYIAERFDNLGIKYYFNEKVPAGDAGLCLGQAYLASVIK